MLRLAMYASFQGEDCVVDNGLNFCGRDEGRRCLRVHVFAVEIDGRTDTRERTGFRMNISESVTR
jgi:hypothetical protein